MPILQHQFGIFGFEWFAYASHDSPVSGMRPTVSETGTLRPHDTDDWRYKPTTYRDSAGFPALQHSR
jgi:hypothetical protein